MKTPNSLLHIEIEIDHDLVHNGHLTTGLFELEGCGLIATTWKMPLRMTPKHVACASVFLTVTHPDGRQTRHCFDFHDGRESWNQPALERCGIYWKANYHPDHVGRLPDALRDKVLPYGLYFPARSRHDRLALWRLGGSARAMLAWRRHKKQLRFPGDLRAQPVSRYRRYKSRLLKEEYESRTLERAAGVYFHPGCWPMNEESNRQTNATRQHIIRGLQKSLGERFVGGFVANATARQHFPQEFYEGAATHPEYVRMLQSSYVVISTNGIEDCHSWRTAEALAAGAILVTERPVNFVDHAFYDCPGVFFYDTPEECVAMCDALLSRPAAEIEVCQRAVQDYYSAFLEPGGRLHERLQTTEARLLNGSRPVAASLPMPMEIPPSS